MTDTKRYVVLAFKLLVVPVALGVLAIEVAGDPRMKLREVEPLLVAAAVAVNQVALLLFAFRMQLAMRAFGVVVNFLQSLRVHLQSTFYFFVLPMTVGLELSRFTKIRNMLGEKAPAGPLTYALLTDRLIGALAALAIALALLPFVDFRGLVRWGGDSTRMLLMIAIAVAVGIGVGRKRVRRHLGKALELGRSHAGGLWASLAVALLTHCCFGFGIYLAALSANIPIGPLQTLFAISAAMLFVVFPVSFAGVSPVEAAGLGVLVSMGIPVDQAALVVLFSYIAKLIAAFEGGAWEVYEGGGHALRALVETDSSVATEDLTSRTISDFGEQWVSYQENPGYYGSVVLLEDLFGPLLRLDDVRDKTVADIGSGTGRIVNMLLDAGAATVVAVEPSAAFTVLQSNTAARKEKVTYLNVRGDALPANLDLDLVVSIGVLHHIPDPRPVVEAAYRALQPGGRMLVWLYGREGNEAYLRLARPLRAVTKRLPHWALELLCSTINVALDPYIFLCRFIPLPMRKYMRNVLARFPRSIRRLTIYDQLNPAYAKYYSQDEAQDLLATAGFAEVSSWHRHGYSWSVVGRKPSP